MAASRNGTRIWIEIIFFSVIFSENEFFLGEILILNYCTFQTNVTLAETARQHRSRQLQQQFLCQLNWIVLKKNFCVCVFLLQCSNINCTNSWGNFTHCHLGTSSIRRMPNDLMILLQKPITISRQHFFFFFFT